MWRKILCEKISALGGMTKVGSPDRMMKIVLVNLQIGSDLKNQL